MFRAGLIVFNQGRSKMRLSKFLALTAATASLILIMAPPSHAQSWTTRNAAPPPLQRAKPVAPTVRDHRKATVAPTVRDHRKATVAPTVRDHRQSTQAKGKSQGIVSATGSGIKKGAKTVAGAAVAPVRGAVNAGSKVVGGAKKVGGAVIGVGKKLNPF